MKKAILILFALVSTAVSAKENITYFSCEVKEGKTDVRVKFAIKDLNPEKATGELVAYPGSDENAGMILVAPERVGKSGWTKMSNLNGQGGDLRMRKSGDIYLYGDGDGYQETDLVLWYDGGEIGYREGYVRDYGAAYAEEELTFKQFITCESSKEAL